MSALIRTLPVLLFLSACGKKEAGDPARDVMPKGATMVITMHGDNPNQWEKSFTTQAAYPALGISDEAFARLQKNGWKRCESTYDKWADYVDRARGTPATVYQRTQYWSRASDVLKITYAYRVETGGDSDAALSAQRVTLSFFGAQSAKDMERWKLGWGASC